MTGVVQDPSGAVVVGAKVDFTSDKGAATATSNSSGTFTLRISFSVPDASRGKISVVAQDFAPFEQTWNGESQVRIVLQPEVSRQHVIVSAARIDTPLQDSPSDSILLNSEYLNATPALALDDVLRKVPGFTLFRRTSSRTANPSTQGVSLRGLGASGTSRALVLVEDVPLNDPFGGWVYWDRVARESISGVELIRGGGGASLYGSTALGGVIQLRTRQPDRPAVSVEGSWGNENTPELSAWAGTRLGPWNASLATDLFRSDGYIPVPEERRGNVDSPANSRHELVTLEVGRKIGDRAQMFARGSYFDESRHNGTIVQRNATELGEFSAGWNYSAATAGAFSARMFGLFESYEQTFSSVAGDRNSENLTNHQRVPSQSLGGNLQWSRPVGHRQTLVAGFEMREVHGSSNEDIFQPGMVPNGHNLSGGRERTTRIFGEDIIQFGRLTANLSLGYDHWSDFDARRIRINPDETIAITPYPARTSNAFNPRLALLLRLGHGTSLVASAYRAFRAPTLNELYRGFRVGNVVTTNNPDLRAERLTGVESGVRQRLLSDHLSLRATFFWNDMTNTIMNVTISDPGADPIIRQKQNVGRTLSTGLNIDGEFRVTSKLQIAAGYQYTHAVISAYTPDPSLENPDLAGKWIPQVPHQQFTVQTRYVNPRLITATVQGTFVGQQFDDDLNSLLLDRYFSVDAYVSRNLGKGLEGFVAVENVFNTRWAVAATPVTSLGPPVLARIGLTYQLRGR